MTKFLSSVVAGLVLCHVVIIRASPGGGGPLTNLFKDFDYSARGFDCNEGDFVDK